jgi:hypothetical protein
MPTNDARLPRQRRHGAREATYTRGHIRAPGVLPAILACSGRPPGVPPALPVSVRRGSVSLRGRGCCWRVRSEELDRRERRSVSAHRAICEQTYT